MLYIVRVRTEHMDVTDTMHVDELYKLRQLLGGKATIEAKPIPHTTCADFIKEWGPF